MRCGGNVFTFVMEHDKVSFVEAVRTLAQRAGITLPADGAGGRGESTEHEGLYDACKTAGLYFLRKRSSIRRREARARVFPPPWIQRCDDHEIRSRVF